MVASLTLGVLEIREGLNFIGNREGVLVVVADQAVSKYAGRSYHHVSPGGLDIDGEHLPGGDLTIRVIPDALKFSCGS